MSAKPFILIDLEATCWEGAQSVKDMEIIEIGAVVTNASGDILSSYNSFIKPVIKPTLSEFCTKLTGISQQDVDSAPAFKDAVTAFDDWFKQANPDFWASWGKYDFDQFQQEVSRLEAAPRFIDTPHLNLKRPWRKTTQHKSQALRAALDFHNLVFQGQPHRALDDVKNIARLVRYISPEQMELEITEVLGRA